MIHFILGGARSGKSSHALQVDSDVAGEYHFIATAETVDEEFAQRIRMHQQTRDDRWQTVEAPLQIVTALRGIDAGNTIVVVDCLSVWLGNLLHYEQSAEACIDDLLHYLPTAAAEVRLVSNEVGSGLVPESPLGRSFRDLQGRLNQRVASIADRVDLVVAGIPLRIKPQGG